MRISRPRFVSSVLLALSAALVLLSAAGAAQETRRETLRLLNDSQIRLPISSFLPGDAVQCDNNGFLYFRVRDDDGQHPLRTAVAAISPSGFVARSFSLGSVPGFELSVTASVPDFVVTGNGAVDLLMWERGSSGPELYVIHFNGAGRYLGRVKLSHFFLPLRFAVLPGGSYFVLALARDAWDVLQSKKTGKPTAYTQPVGAFFDSTGKLRWEINLPGAAAPAAQGPAPARNGAPAVSVDRPIAVAASDGSVYVMRYKPTPALYVVTNSGASVDWIPLDPPFPNAAVAGIVAIGSRRVVVHFVRRAGAPDTETSDTVFSITDAGSGIRLVDYQASPETAGALGCYTQNGFELLARQPDGKLVVRFVAGK